MGNTTTRESCIRALGLVGPISILVASETKSKFGLPFVIVWGYLTMWSLFYPYTTYPSGRVINKDE